MISIVEQIFSYGKEHPDKIALINGTENISYNKLLKNILYAKKMLVEKYNIKKSDSVILAADKQTEFVSVYFACHLMEVVTLPIAPDTNSKRYNLIKNKVEPKLVIGFDKSSDNEIVMANFNDFKANNFNLEIEDTSFPSLDALADIIFTTGTTGEPKGVQLSHRNIMAAARNINTFIGNSQEDVEMLALPISHSFGLGRMRCALSNGQTLVLLGSFANVKRFFKFMKDYNVSGFGMVPASWALLKKMSGNEIEKYKKQIRYIEIGSSPMMIEEKKYLIKALPETRICMHYGLTEASRSAFIEFHKEEKFLDSVGKQSPNVNITIRDDYGNEVPNGEEGEICVSGDVVTVGYLALPKEDSFWGETFRTGDWGIKNQEGYITLMSRKKELINVGGKKVSPIEVEEILKKIDFIDDCVCVGIPDPNGILNEVVKAFVVSNKKEMIKYEIIDSLIGNQLESFKHPVDYCVIEEVPKTSSGKIQRLSLK